MKLISLPIEVINSLTVQTMSRENGVKRKASSSSDNEKTFEEEESFQSGNETDASSTAESSSDE